MSGDGGLALQQDSDPRKKRGGAARREEIILVSQHNRRMADCGRIWSFVRLRGQCHHQHMWN